MQIGIAGIIGVFAMGYISAILCLVGVALGGYLVYKTKREAHESLFTPAKAADVGTAQSEFDDEDDLDWGTDVSGRTSEFLQKVKEDLNKTETGDEEQQ